MKSTINSSSWAGVIISLLVALAFGFWSILLGQDRNWDLLNYHLYNPYAFLNGRIELDLAPAGVQTFFSPVIDIAYFTAISHLSPRTVGFILGFLQGLNFLLLYKIAARVLKGREHSNIYSLLLALGGVLTVGFMAEVGTTMHDSLVALFPLLSLWLIVSSIDSLDTVRRGPFWIMLTSAGVISGTGIGLKLVSAIYALPLCLSLLILPLPLFRRFQISFIFGLSVLFGLFVTGGYWLYEVWRLFGNPLFPQFNNYFHGELASFEETRDLRFLPRTMYEKIFYPVIFTFDPQRVAEIKYQQFSWLITYLAIIGLFLSSVLRFFRGKRVRLDWDPKAIYLLSFFCISYVLWLNIFGIYRYLIVIELLVPLLLFVIITHFFRSRQSSLGALIFLGILTLVNIRGTPDWGHSEWSGAVYSVETNELTELPEPAAVFLAGQPLAWLVPALDINTPFIQVDPNMSVSDAYWQRAKILTADRSGKSFVIYESDDAVIRRRSQEALEKLDLIIDDNHCGNIKASLGQTSFEYRFCELRNMESE